MLSLSVFSYPVTITGNIKDSVNPVSSWKISLTTMDGNGIFVPRGTKTTDINGNYTFSLNLVSGGYTFIIKTININGDTTTETKSWSIYPKLNFTADPITLNITNPKTIPITLTGTVYDNCGNPLDGTITIRKKNNYSGVNDSTNVLTNVKNGSYSQIINIVKNPNFQHYNIWFDIVSNGLDTTIVEKYINLNYPELYTNTFILKSICLYNNITLNGFVSDSCGDNTGTIVFKTNNNDSTIVSTPIGEYGFYSQQIKLVNNKNYTIYYNITLGKYTKLDSINFNATDTTITKDFKLNCVIDTSVGINPLTITTNKVFISNNTLNITTVKPSNVSVYNLSGQIIYSGTLNGNVLIDLTTKGLYIVKVDKDVIKVIK